MISSLVAIGAFAFVAGLVHGAQPSAFAELMQETLAEHLSEPAATGATAAVIMPNGEMHRAVWGQTAGNDPEPMPASARMLAGSTGKTFFSIVLLQLIDEGVLSLDDLAADHLGGFEWFDRVPNAGAITLRHLANHTSGLRDHVWFESFQSAIREDLAREWAHDELGRQLAGSEALFEPGEAWAYSDSNYILLGLVIEKVTGRDAYDLIGERVLTPLGLEGTSASDRAALPGLVAGTTTIGEAFGIGPVVGEGSNYGMNPQWEWAGGGMISTSADLATFFRAIFTTDLLAPASREELLRFVPAELGPGSGYSVGIIRLQTAAGEEHGHLGIMPGYLTYVMHHPEHGATVALQVNADDGPTRSAQVAAASAIASAVFEQIKPRASDP